MSPFWSSLVEHLRTCGRDATLFMVVFVVLLVGGVLTARVSEQAFLSALPWIGLAALAWSGVAIFRYRRRSRERTPRQPLSADEMRVARSKLKLRR